MSFSKESITRALRGVPAAGASGDLVSAGVLKWVSLCETYVSVKLLMPQGATPGDISQVTSMARAAIESAATDEGVVLFSGSVLAIAAAFWPGANSRPKKKAPVVSVRTAAIRNSDAPACVQGDGRRCVMGRG